jgi:DNA-binding NtrC family response regulator
VGKEVTARAIRDMSPRAGGPFVRVNCAAIPETLLDTELFGHERGAFTGATSAKSGLIEAADGGTLFLDEIGEAPAGVQAKLLRTLETREVRRVGGVDTRAIDVRFIAATNRDLPMLVASGAFRRDLYFRLNGLCIQIPPLRERKDEILPLARAFLEEFSGAMGRPTPGLSSVSVTLLREHAFPGNVRELRTMMQRALVLCEGAQIRPEHLGIDLATEEQRGRASPSTVRSERPEVRPTVERSGPADGDPPVRPKRLAQEIRSLEQQRIIAALEQTGGNQKRAAERLGIARRTLIHRIEAYGLPRPRKGRT